jgi:hypothetical protein
MPINHAAVMLLVWWIRAAGNPLKQARPAAGNATDLQGGGKHKKTAVLDVLDVR